MPTREDMTIDSNSGAIGQIPNGKTYLFFIAIDEYRNGITQLSNAVRDAKAVAECLMKNYELGEPDLNLLINGNATQAAIANAFENYLNLVTEDDNLILYFSGHGSYYPKTKRGYWLTAESKSGDKSSFYSNSEVIDFIAALKVKHFFGIVDACFSGAFFIDRNASPLLSRRYRIPSRWLLTSGRLEPVSDGSLGDHSPFAKVLLTQLKYQEKPYLWGSELCNNVLDAFTYKKEKQLPRGQPLQDMEHQGGDFAFVRKGQIFPAQGLVSPGKISNSENEMIPASLIQFSEGNIDDVKDLLEELISNDEWGETFEKLKKVVMKGKKKRLLIQIISRYNSAKEIKMEATDSPRNIRIEFNRIKSDLLTFINDLQRKDFRTIR